MRKVLALLLFILLALISMTGYLFLTEKISTGRQQIADGEKQLEKGQQMLAEGKAKLARGKRKLSQAKRFYGDVNDIPLVGIASKLPISGIVFDQAKSQISEGDQLVAKGEVNVKVGEGRLAAGKLALSRGKEHLSVANSIRLACAAGAAFFASLAMALGFYWRQALVRTFSK